MEDLRRLDQLERESAVVQDRQNRYDATQQLLLAKLDSIQRDMAATRELIVTSLTGYVTHTAHQQRNTDVDGRFDRLESKVDGRFNRLEGRVDGWVKWLLGAVFGASLSLLAEVFRLITHT